MIFEYFNSEYSKLPFLYLKRTKREDQESAAECPI